MKFFKDIFNFFFWLFCMIWMGFFVYGGILVIGYIIVYGNEILSDKLMAENIINSWLFLPVLLLFSFIFFKFSETCKIVKLTEAEKNKAKEKSPLNWKNIAIWS